MPKWQVKRKLFGQKSQLINMTKNCQKSQVTQKIVRVTIFRNFCKFCWIHNSLWTSVIINMTKNCKKSQLARKIVRLAIFRNTRKIAIFAAECKPGHKWQIMRRTYLLCLAIFIWQQKAPIPRKLRFLQMQWLFFDFSNKSRVTSLIVYYKRVKPLNLPSK